jgi:phosphonate transport system substrate-binding protein
MRSIAMLLAALPLAASAQEPAATPAPAAPKIVAPLKLALAAPSGKDEAQLAAREIETGLGRVIGRGVRAIVYRDYDSAARALASGDVDLAWLQPFAYVLAARRAQVTPLVKATRQGMPFYRSVIFARADSGMKQLTDLNGKKVAWTEVNSSSGFLVPSAMLRRANVAPKEMPFLGDHEAVCKAVWEKKADAGATFSSDQGKTADGCKQALEGKSGELALLGVSPPIPNDVVAGRPGLDEAIAAAVKNGLIALDKKSADGMVLTTAFAADGFAETSDDEFAPLRDLAPKP